MSDHEDRSVRRRRKVLQAQHYRRQGRSIAEIARLLDQAPATIKAYLYDPTGKKARATKARYRGSCDSCGAPTRSHHRHSGRPTLRLGAAPPLRSPAALYSIAGRQAPSRALSGDVSDSRRRSTFVLAPLAALALLVGGFLIARPDRTPETAYAPVATQPPALDSPASSSLPASKRPTTRAGSPKPASARTAARRFVADYLQLIRGREATRTLSAAAPELRRDLRHHPARPTPTQEVRPATVRAVDVTLQGPDSVRAIATLQAAGGPPYPLLLYLERRGARWRVTRIGDA